MTPSQHTDIHYARISFARHFQLDSMSGPSSQRQACYLPTSSCLREVTEKALHCKLDLS